VRKQSMNKEMSVSGLLDSLFMFTIVVAAVAGVVMSAFGAFAGYLVYEFGYTGILYAAGFIGIFVSVILILIWVTANPKGARDGK